MLKALKAITWVGIGSAVLGISIDVIIGTYSDINRRNIVGRAPIIFSEGLVKEHDHFRLIRDQGDVFVNYRYGDVDERYLLPFAWRTWHVAQLEFSWSWPPHMGRADSDSINQVRQVIADYLATMSEPNNVVAAVKSPDTIVPSVKWLALIANAVVIFMVVALFGVIFMLTHLVIVRRRIRYQRCPKCGYDIAHQVLHGCPECGWSR